MDRIKEIDYFNDKLEYAFNDVEPLGLQPSMSDGDFYDDNDFFPYDDRSRIEKIPQDWFDKEKNEAIWSIENRKPIYRDEHWREISAEYLSIYRAGQLHIPFNSRLFYLPVMMKHYLSINKFEETAVASLFHWFESDNEVSCENSGLFSLDEKKKEVIAYFLYLVSSEEDDVYSSIASKLLIKYWQRYMSDEL